MDIKVKLLVPNAKLPTKKDPGDAGSDLTCTSKWEDKDGNVCYGTGVAMEIPDGYVGLAFPRSSNAAKDLMLSNGVGVIDSTYRGEILFKFKRTPVFISGYNEPKEYEVGDRVGQIIIMPIPRVNFIEADELSETKRGKGGYGSTGR